MLHEVFRLKHTDIGTKDFIFYVLEVPIHRIDWEIEQRTLRGSNRDLDPFLVYAQNKCWNMD